MSGFYSTAEWRRVRRAVLQRVPWCALCGAKATHVDHITPRRSAGDDAPANLRGLCRSCHASKTAREDGGFGNPTSRARVGQLLDEFGLTARRMIQLAADGVRFVVEEVAGRRVGQFYVWRRLVISCYRPDGRRVALWPGKGGGRRTTWEVGRWLIDGKGWSSLSQEEVERLRLRGQRLVGQLDAAVEDGGRHEWSGPASD